MIDHSTATDVTRYRLQYRTGEQPLPWLVVDAATDNAIAWCDTEQAAREVMAAARDARL